MLADYEAPPLDPAIRDYARYRGEPEAWMLGRFKQRAGARKAEHGELLEESEGDTLGVRDLPGGNPSRAVAEGQLHHGPQGVLGLLRDLQHVRLSEIDGIPGPASLSTRPCENHTIGVGFSSIERRPMRPESPAMVDPRLPRTGQAITGTALGLAFVLDWPVVVPVVSAVLAGASLLGPRANLYTHVFRWARRTLPLRPPAYLEEAAPPRFSNTLGFLFTAATTAAHYVLGAATAGWALALIVAALALLAASTGLCVGCELYVLVRRLATRGRVARRLTVPGSGA